MPGRSSDLTGNSIISTASAAVTENGSGETGMPAFDNLGPAERWDLVNFILSLQEKTQNKGHGIKKGGDRHDLRQIELLERQLGRMNRAG
jgi:mono/diheme cytochrome c family protein